MNADEMEIVVAASRDDVLKMLNSNEFNLAIIHLSGYCISLQLGYNNNKLQWTWEFIETNTTLMRTHITISFIHSSFNCFFLFPNDIWSLVSVTSMFVTVRTELMVVNFLISFSFEFIYSNLRALRPMLSTMRWWVRWPDGWFCMCVAS